MPKSSRSRSRKYSRRSPSRSRKYSRRSPSRSRKYSRRSPSRSRKYSRRSPSRSRKYSRRQSKLKAKSYKKDMKKFDYYTPIDKVLNELKLDEQNDKQLIWVNPTMSKYGPIPLSYTFYIYKHNKNNKVETFSSQSLSLKKSYTIHPIVEDRVNQLSSYSKEECIDYYINWNDWNA